VGVHGTFVHAEGNSIKEISFWAQALAEYLEKALIDEV